MDEARTIVIEDRVYRPLMDENLTSGDLEKARRELNETPEIRTAVLQMFKVRLESETQFRPRIEDDYLIRFLRVRKFDVERAYQCLRLHYWFRNRYPDCFPAPSNVERILRANIFNYLPHRDHMGRAIFIVKFANWDPDSVPYDDFVAAGNLMSEYVLDNPVTQINGYIGIWDYSGFQFKHFRRFCSPRNIMLLIQIMQDCFPGRFKIAYCINCHALVNTAWSYFRRVLREKFRRRVVILSGDMRVLHGFVDPAILPAEYGGNLPQSSSEEMANRVLANEERFNENRSYGFP